MITIQAFAGLLLAGCQGVADTDASPTYAELEAQGFVLVDRKWGDAGPAEIVEGGVVAAIPVEAMYMGLPSGDGVTIERQWTCPAVDGVVHLEWKCRKFDPSKDEIDG